MTIPYYEVDAFAGRVFSGNPAGVCFLDAWLDDAVLQNIAAENNFSETAFLVATDGGYELRWFTPVCEVILCGHATLASAHVLFAKRGWPGEIVPFHTRKSGMLTVKRSGELLVMDFPARQTVERPAPAGLAEALGATPRECYAAGEDYLLVYENEEQIAALSPDMQALTAIECRGTIATAPGTAADFVSRFFAPRFGVPEDPVTGSAHCALIPYWSSRLGKKTLHAFQRSKRGGELFCENRGDRVGIAGRAVVYLEGTVHV